jgi:hypothetical protein
MKEIVAIDGNSGLAGSISQIINRFKGQLDRDLVVVTVYSVKDMVEKVSMAAGGDKISRLFIEGHGASGFQCVGCGFIGNALKNKTKPDYLEFSELEGKLKNGVEQYLSQLIPKFSIFSSVVSLGGCQVGSPPFGDKLLMQISTSLGGVPVEAGVDNQRPLLPGYEGNVLRCGENFCLPMQASWGY